MSVVRKSCEMTDHLREYLSKIAMHAAAISAFALLPEVARSCPLEGYWRSDEAKTLASLSQAKDLTEAQRTLLTDDFFGKLFIHMECDRFTSVYEDFIQSSSYELLSSSKSQIRFKYHNDFEGEVVSTATIEGDCYWVPIVGGSVREYFCPIEEWEYTSARELAKESEAESEDGCFSED